MRPYEPANPQIIARYAGWSLLGTIIVGIATSLFIAQGIDVNLSAEVAATAENMLVSETRLRAKAYFGILSFALQAMIAVGFLLLLKKHGPLLAGSSFVLSITGAILILLGAVFAMNSAELSSHIDYATLATDDQKLLLTGLQATSDYTAFHLGLVVSTLANAGFFYLFLKSKLIPSLIASWGLFASIYVVLIVIARDFIPALGSDLITAMFMVCNLIALVSTGVYMSFKGVRTLSD